MLSQFVSPGIYRSTIKWLSLLSVYFLTGSGLLGLVLFMVSPSHMESDYDGCHQHFEDEQPLRVSNVVIACVMTVNKLIFLALYILPLRIHVRMNQKLSNQMSATTMNVSLNNLTEPEVAADRKHSSSIVSPPPTQTRSMSTSTTTAKVPFPRTTSDLSRKHSFAAASDVGMSKRSERRMGVKVTTILRQCVVISSVSIVIDILALIYNAVLPLEFPRVLLLLSFDIVLVLNVFGASLLFRDFKKMWTSLFTICFKKDESSDAAYSSARGVLKSKQKER